MVRIVLDYDQTTTNVYEHWSGPGKGILRSCKGPCLSCSPLRSPIWESKKASDGLEESILSSNGSIGGLNLNGGFQGSSCLMSMADAFDQ